MSMPNSVDDMAEKFKALSNPVAVRCLAILKDRQGGTKVMQEATGLESSATSSVLTNLCKAGVVKDMTPDKSRHKEYAIDPADSFSTAIAQWAGWVNSLTK